MTITLDPSQAAAVELLLTAPLCVMTGGAGVGKTTTTKAALDRMDERGERYLLAATTGKAARRMTEATSDAGRAPGRPEATTVHRLLGYLPGAGFARNADNPIEADAVLVDECSMLDVELARALFEAIDPSRTRLALIGDANQLPSVGPGRVFADLIDSGKVPVARLTKLHRAAAERWVASQSPVILEGRLPDLRERPDFVWLEREHRDDAVDALIEIACTLPPGCESADDAQVLVPQNVGPAGVDAINLRLQARLNAETPAGSGWKIGSGKRGESAEIRLRDRVIQTRNDYTLDVMNGEIGRVVSVGAEELSVDFGEPPSAGSPGSPRVLTYSRDAARSLRLAYALTIHKYQGSQIPWAILFVHSTHTQMLTRGLLYTAVTRASHGVVIVGDRVGLDRAVKNAADSRRNTGLIERLRAADEPTEGSEGERAA